MKLLMKLQNIAASFHKIFRTSKSKVLFFSAKKYGIMTFDRILLRYEVLDSQVKLQRFLQSYSFIFKTSVEISKFQIRLQR